MPVTLAECHVPRSNNTYYIPNFVTEDEEAFLLRKVSQSFLYNVIPVMRHRVDSGNTSAEVETAFKSEVCFVDPLPRRRM